MRLTRALYAGLKDITIRRFKQQWLEKGKIYDEPLRIPQALIGKGVKIVDASTLLEEKELEWKPPVSDDPRWIKEVPLEAREDWHTQPAFTFNEEVQLYEGMKQACLIAKAQHFDELPSAVQQRIGAVETPDRDILLQRYIMLAQHWNTDEEPLPRRPRPPERGLELPVWSFHKDYGVPSLHKRQIMMHNLLRLCQFHVVDTPSLAGRQHIYNPLLHSYVMYKDKPIIQKQVIDCMMTSNSALHPFAGGEAVAASVHHEIPDMWPVYPTVDFVLNNSYEINNIPCISSSESSCHPHTLLTLSRNPDWSLEWSDSQCQASQMMTCLMYTAALARDKFGADVKVLPEPISVQHIRLDISTYHITCFQLNSLDLDNTDGVKNLVWTSKQESLYEKILSRPWLKKEDPTEAYDKLRNFDGDAFEPFLATYLNGCPDIPSLSSSSSEAGS